MTQAKRATCDGTGWVCEVHPDRPWEGPLACGCGGAGDPCPVCNSGDPPDLPSGSFTGGS